MTVVVTNHAGYGYIVEGTYDWNDAWKKVPSFMPRENDFHCEIAERIEQLLADWGISKKEK